MNNMNWKHIIGVVSVTALLSACAAEPPKETPEQTKPAAAEQTEAAKETVETATASDTYLVVRGDSLWKISGKPDIYNNPYHWPLIYKANRDKIEDADLIYPGQELVIERGSSQSDIDAAVEHAKTRGAWSIGAVEASDKAYLAR
ncbi:MAG: LysM peptidoglycan-binding domain-containing protein [Gammaproteobacteria bacterium]|nr:LysM peptidoglycan-binding domain-containing protein [Gammaproteobacteria bacterium]